MRNLDGTAKKDGDTDHAIARICRSAGLPEADQVTMLYVHVAENHASERPEHIREAARAADDPDRRILAMLGARGKAVARTAGAASASGQMSAG